MTVRYPDPFGPLWRFNYVRVLLQWSGSIFQYLIWEWFIVVGAAAASITVWIYVFDYSKDLQSWRQNTELLRHAIDYITVRFQAAISLMLGFYTMTLFNRWWAVRLAMQDIQ